MRTSLTWLISDTHFNHDNIATYCDRPENFTEMILKRWGNLAMEHDTTIHLGDVAIGKKRHVKEMLSKIPGRKILVRGNHDGQSCNWWMNNGFDFACDAMIYRGMWLTHRPAHSLPQGCFLNIHGHLHNIWHGFHPDGGKEKFHTKTALKHPWQRLFAIEYTNYSPVEFDKFVSHPDKYLAKGPKKGTS